MNREIYYLLPNQGRGKHNNIIMQSRKWNKHDQEDGFSCQHCGAYVAIQMVAAGVQNRNHCPFCLWSRHVDHFHAGDRMSACKAIMQPIGITVKQTRNKYASYSKGELMLIHRCSECGKLSINRIAADDQAEVLLSIYHASLNLEEVIYQHLDQAGIHPLLGSDETILTDQLFGRLIYL